MRKIMYLFFVMLLAVTLQAAELLKVDFDANLWGVAGVTETGYETYVCAHEDPASFGAESYSAFGTTVTIEPTWPSGAPAAAMQGLNRAQSGEFPFEYTATEGLDLVAEWIGTDTRENPSQPLTLTITGLPAGNYDWVSYHHDLWNQPGLFDVTVNDASGSTTLSGFVQTDNATNLDEVGKCELTIASNGSDPVSLEFTASSMFFVMNGFDLTLNFIRGGATDPVPVSGTTTVDSQATTAVSWTAPVDPNLVSVGGYDVYFGTDPNVILNTKTTVATESLPVSLTYDTTYYWRVDSHVVWDSNDITGVVNDTVEGSIWTFTTLPQDKTPVVTAANVLTAVELLPATLTAIVDDWNEDDIASIAWEVVVPQAGMRMINRTGQLGNLTGITSDPSLLQDWIGSDTREAACNPLTLTLKGLPSGTYSWTSYHHDADNQRGTFDATVNDASGTATTPIVISYGINQPVSVFTTPIVSDGSDITLSFKVRPYGGDVNIAFFAMNGFELTDGVSVVPLFIDFGPVGAPTMPGYQAYEATTQNAASFTEQSYSAFGATVSIQPTWGGVATVTKTTTDPKLATQQASFSTDRAGTFSVKVFATDDTVFGPNPLTGSATLTVRVGADACAAAQLSSSWPGFNSNDFNQDCEVNLEDFAVLAAGWLDDRNLAGQE